MSSYSLTSYDIKKQHDYIYTMNDINEMLSVEPVIGSQKVGHKYALFYKEQIAKMLENDNVNLDILKDLKERVHKDLKLVRYDRQERSGMSSFTDEQTKKNDVMMSMIMDFIATLPEIV